MLSWDVDQGMLRMILTIPVYRHHHLCTLYSLVGVWAAPLKNMSRQLGWTNSQYIYIWKNKNHVPNHQPLPFTIRNSRRPSQNLRGTRTYIDKYGCIPYTNWDAHHWLNEAMGAQPFWNSETYVSVHGGIASVYPSIAVKCGKSIQIPHEASW